MKAIEICCSAAVALVAAVGEGAPAAWAMEKFALWARQKGEATMSASEPGVCRVSNAGSGDWALSGIPTIRVREGERYAFSCTVRAIDGEKPMPVVLGVVLTDADGKVVNYTHGWRQVACGEKGTSDFAIPAGSASIRPQLCGKGPGAAEVRDVRLVRTVSAPVTLKTLAADNPLGFPEYRQELTATFASEADARAAALSVTALPDGKALAFTSRWDDSNPAHARKAEMLAGNGFRGTFFVTGDTNYLLKTGRSLVAAGHALGNHTLSHPFMMEVTANRAFREIVREKILIETLTGFPVVSYVSPFGWGATLDADRRALVARLLVETGHFVTSDNPVPEARQSPTHWFPTRLFASDDSNPQEKLFKAGIAKALSLAEGSDEIPRITYGIHSWCGPKGTEAQGRWLSAYAHRDDWFYGTDNAYGAYRYSSQSAAPEKVSADGATARFRVRRFEPMFLGDAIPLSLVFSRPPRSVSVNGRALEKTARGTWTLPHDAGRRLCTKVAYVRSDGVRLEIRPDLKGRRVSVVLENGSSVALADLAFFVFLPPVFELGRLSVGVPTLAPGATFEKTFGSLTPAKRPDYADGDAYFAVGVDYSRGEARCRLYADAEVPAAKDRAKGLTPRDVALVAGPFDRKLLEASSLKTLSRVGEELKDFGAGPNEVWRARTDPSRTGHSVYVYMPYGPLCDKAYMEAIKPVVAANRGVRLIAFEFSSPKTGSISLFSSLPAWTHPIAHVNGVRVAIKGVKTDLPATEGWNRLVVSAPLDQTRYPSSVQLCVADGDLTRPLPVRSAR